MTWKMDLANSYAAYGKKKRGLEERQRHQKMYSKMYDDALGVFAHLSDTKKANKTSREELTRGMEAIEEASGREFDTHKKLGEEYSRGDRFLDFIRGNPYAVPKQVSMTDSDGTKYFNTEDIQALGQHNSTNELIQRYLVGEDMDFGSEMYGDSYPKMFKVRTGVKPENILDGLAEDEYIHWLERLGGMIKKPVVGAWNLMPWGDDK